MLDLWFRWNETCNTGPNRGSGVLTIIATWKRKSKKLVVKQSLIQKVSHKSPYDKHMLEKKVDIHWCLENSNSGSLELCFRFHVNEMLSSLYMIRRVIKNVNDSKASKTPSDVWCPVGEDITGHSNDTAHTSLSHPLWRFIC